MKRFFLTFFGSGLAGAVIGYFITLHFKHDPIVEIKGFKIPIQTKEGLFIAKDFYLALGVAAGAGALIATIACWLLFLSPARKRRRK